MFSTPKQQSASTRRQAGASGGTGALASFGVMRDSRSGTPIVTGGADASFASYSYQHTSPLGGQSQNQQQRRRTARRARTPLLLDASQQHHRARGSRSGTPGLPSDRATTPGSYSTEGASGLGVGARAYLSLRKQGEEQAEAVDAAQWIQPGTELVRDELHAVTAYSRLPEQVEHVLAESDLYSTSLGAHLDVTLGFAVLLTPTECYAWNFLAVSTSSSHMLPTCYVFSLPPPAPSLVSSAAPNAAEGAYLHALVPWSNSAQRAEPGLVLVHKRTGHLTLIASIATSSTDANSLSQQGTTARMALAPSEIVTVVHRLSASSNTLVLATSHARLFRAHVVSQGGRVHLHLESQPLASSRSLLGKLFFGGVDVGAAAAASAAGADYAGSIRSLSSCALSTGVESDGRHELLVVSGCTLQRWLVDAGIRGNNDGSALATASSSGDKLLGSVEVRSLFDQEPKSSPVPQLEVHDAQWLLGGDVALLYSCAASATTTPARRFGILIVTTAAHSAHSTSSRVLTKAATSNTKQTKVGTDRSSSTFRIRTDIRLGSGGSADGSFSMAADPRPNSAPRLAAPFGGPVLYAIWPNTVINVILGRALLPRGDGFEDDNGDSEMLSNLVARGPRAEAGAEAEEEVFQHIIHLKQAHQNRLLGFGVEGVDIMPPTQAGGRSIAPLPVLTARSGALLFEFDWLRAEAIVTSKTLGERGDVQGERDRAGERLQMKVGRCQSQLEAAVFFGDLPGNPLEFSIHAGSLGSSSTIANDQHLAIAIAATQLSASLLSSSSPYLPPILDTRAQLAERLARHQRLLQVLGDGGDREEGAVVWAMLDASTKDQLRDHALLLAAALEIWVENEAQARGRSLHVLRQAVNTVLSEASVISEHQQEDTLRAFFTHHLRPLLTQLFALFAAQLKAGSFREAPLGSKTDVLLHVNRVLVAAFQGARRWVEEGDQEQAQWPGPVPASAFESWTCSSASLDALQNSFDATEALLRERSRELGSGIDIDVQGFISEGTQAQREQHELKSYLVQLAHFTLAAYEQRLAYLSLIVADESDALAQQERQALLARFKTARPQVIHSLSRIGSGDQAFSLAERHRDFQVLAQLCTDDERVGSAQSLLHHYVDRYGQPFAFELYAHFVASGQYRRLLEQHSKYIDHLSAFLAAHPELDSLAWIHEVGQARFRDASGTLASVAVSERVLVREQLEFSLAKLAYAAELSEEEVAQEGPQLELQRIDDMLDVVYVQTKLSECFAKQMGSAQAPASHDSDADAYIALFAQRLLQDAYPAFQQHFKECWELCATGQVLGVEDLIDVLTLKDNVDELSEPHFIQALQTYVRAHESLPEARRLAILRAYWRRVLLHDAWEDVSNTAGKSDAEVKQALRETELYCAIASISPEDLDNDVLLPSSALLEPPSREVLQGRFEGSRNDKSEEELDNLLADFATEISEVEQLLESGYGKWFEETKRVAVEDIAAG
ncbi:hypothetical protein K437DRAFT_292500 [Tilletiaria anomala UBC 951]|uniref:Nucleoporin Nup133/Nup155-like C-terminal domain-containing protein n=1 Tax=Tilletiaria anomala (strain ATCC 24038 / CBS 436.72 / UBC 951) TaxID=1037660 RepID=A0A066WPW0_TILAU|nr:uncharacterized protein K437DRAFT_292500 [Tilletiaria anomala UBC 951]KDN53044.1 hypothetical protein K437DRAFT_292500 [Tilletiaria anomala UBC 951]